MAIVTSSFPSRSRALPATTFQAAGAGSSFTPRCYPPGGTFCTVPSAGPFDSARPLPFCSAHDSAAARAGDARPAHLCRNPADTRRARELELPVAQVLEHEQIRVNV